MKKRNFSISNFLYCVLFTIITACIFVTFLIAAPLTERLTDKVSFNLNTKNEDFWSKEYVVSVVSTDDAVIEETKDIIYKRLKDFGVEKINIYETGEVVTEPLLEDDGETSILDLLQNSISDSEEKDTTEYSKTLLKVVVGTTRGSDNVRPLLNQRYNYKIMTRKSDVDFDDSNNFYAAFLEGNYDDTGFDSSTFRNVYITKLATSSGDKAYFVIFKPWISKIGKLRSFLESHEGEEIGVSVDGFVYSYTVPDDVTSSDYIYISTYSTDEEEVAKLSSLYNSGILPTVTEVRSETDLDTEIVTVDYVKVMIGFAISLVTIYLYLLIFGTSSKQSLLQSFFATVITLSIYVSYLKLTDYQVDTFLLTIEAILVAVLAKVLVENKDSTLFILGGLLLMFILVLFFGAGVVALFAKEMIFVTLLTGICLLFSGWYIDKVKKL